MTKATIRISFGPESAPLDFERELEFADLREPGGKEFVALYEISRMAVESKWAPYYLDLPDVPFARPLKQSFRLADFASSEYENRINTHAMWMELSHTMLRSKVLLAKSRAFHDEEQEQSTKAHSETENIVWHLHLDKMDNFDLATIFLGKVNELAARLVFERLGASLIPGLNTDDPDWERLFSWTKIKAGLSARAGNPLLAAIPDAEYQELQSIFDDFLKTEHGKRGWAYRVRLVHRITPSVDHPGLYTQLGDRERTPLLDDSGQVKGWTKGLGGMRRSAEYSFVDLYDDATLTFRHYISLLERLYALPRFSSEAEAPKGQSTLA